MEHTAENIEQVARDIVDGMDLESLVDFAVEDLYSVMLEDREIFDANVESLKEV